MTDRPTNRPTDKAGCIVACTRLKTHRRSDRQSGSVRQTKNRHTYTPSTSINQESKKEWLSTKVFFSDPIPSHSSISPSFRPGVRITQRSRWTLESMSSNEFPSDPSKLFGLPAADFVENFLFFSIF